MYYRVAEKEGIKVLILPSQGSELSQDLQKVMHKKMCTNLSARKHCCKEEWAKFLHKDVRD